MAFSKHGLANLQDVLNRHVAKGSVPGLVAVVAKGDETHVFPVGSMTLEGKSPVRRDTIFRLSSMTKPIVAVAAMMLVEEGRLKLEEPIDRLAPELANRRVVNTNETALKGRRSRECGVSEAAGGSTAMRPGSARLGHRA